MLSAQDVAARWGVCVQTIYRLASKKDGLPELARDIVDNLKFDFNCQYDEKDSIGKRYRRQDAIGTPYCITVDHQTKEDNCVTIRNRDTMTQERIPIAEVAGIIRERTDYKPVLQKLNKIG